MDANNIMKPNDLFSIHVSGLTIPISDSIVMMWIVMAVLIILSLVFARNLKTIPKGKQNVVELIVDTVNNIVKGNLGHHWKSFAPYFGTILLFLVLSNMAGLFSVLPTAEELYKLTGNEFFEGLPQFSIAAPTKDLNITLGMALMSVVLVLFAGIRFRGVKGWLHGFLEPSPVMAPFHVLDYATRTLSLSLRLFGNMLAGYIIVEMVYEATVFIKPILPLASFFFDIFDAILQAYIFVFLSSIYIKEAIE